MPKKFKHYQYKNLTFVILCLIFSYFLAQSPLLNQLLTSLGEWGYIGAVIAGVLFVSTFTVGIGTVILLILAEHLNIFELGILAGFGGVLGDLLVFQFVKTKGLSKEVTSLIKQLGGQKLRHLVHTKYFRWWLPVLGALIIASPLPDELGVSLMGLSKMSTARFMVLTFTLNTVGITTILIASNYIKP